MQWYTQESFEMQMGVNYFGESQNIQDPTAAAAAAL